MASRKYDRESGIEAVRRTQCGAATHLGKRCIWRDSALVCPVAEHAGSLQCIHGK